VRLPESAHAVFQVVVGVCQAVEDNKGRGEREKRGRGEEGKRGMGKRGMGKWGNRERGE
jgi:hypothetical protein